MTALPGTAHDSASGSPGVAVEDSAAHIGAKVSEKFDRKRRFSDIDALFRQEDACNEAAGKAA